MPDQRTLVVVGTGTANGAPDQCIIHLSLNGIGGTPAESLEICSTAADAAIEALVVVGIDRTEIRTVNLSVQDYFDQAQQKVTARIGSYQLDATVRELGQLSRVLEALSTSAGDALQIRGLQLGIRDTEPLRREARRNAVSNAQEKASQLAEAAGLRLGAVITLEDGEVSRSPGHGGMRAMAASASMPVEPGQVAVSASVTISYALEE